MNKGLAPNEGGGPGSGDGFVKEEGSGEGTFDTDEGRGDGFVTVEGCGDATDAVELLALGAALVVRPIIDGFEI